MRTLAEILGGLTGLYMLLITVRVIITWFSRGYYGKPYEVLCRVTDPYLNWFRRFPVFKTGRLDLSPIAAMTALSLARGVFSILAAYGRITLPLFLALLVSAVWSAASFVLGFCIIILILHLAAMLFRWGGIFRQVIDAVAQPLLYRIGRLFFRRRLVDYRTGIIVALASLALASLLGNWLIKGLLLPLLTRPPV